MFLNQKRTFLTEINFLPFYGQRTHYFIKITDFWNSIKTLFYSFDGQHYRNEVHFFLKSKRVNKAGIKREGMDFEYGFLEHFMLSCSTLLSSVVALSKNVKFGFNGGKRRPY